MRARSSPSLASLLWDVVRVGVRSFWQSKANPARSFLLKQQALSVLGLPLNATPQQIKRRYRQLAMRYHPDRGGDPRQMQRVIEAYNILMKELSPHSNRA
ncbi:DnaJ-like protein [Thermosporothrix hazakensis]|jgi:hypothetical protein|uniref:DnaJ-like protein n=2 Tax=Thermosporothrix TaxID=768650 RepID=A0A326U795_THEHA|nr:J domain-containing protein [Thermosporothrix hazakensis]PZW30668.1 DnaJ-like protein [Thermosporothrix hazakensis]BBH91384.1 hypothetical protein KTC_61350 [Thermosporothrix sp. COM3]GCE49530.1 hypothetical protein KTH_43990 [Thermosporothrix hazakensis]